MSSTQKNINLAVSRSFAVLGMVFSLFGLVTGISTSISTQATPVYSCPAGSVLVGANCTTPRKVLCSDLSAADANGNCSQGQSALFPCDGRTGQIVILEMSNAMSNNTRGTTLCTTRTFLFNRTEATTAGGCVRTDYMLNPNDARWMNEYTLLANTNDQFRETLYCQNGVRVCPIGQRLFYYPGGTNNRLLPDSGIVCVISSFNFRDNGLLPIAYTRNGANTAAECDASIYDVISIWDWNGGDAEDSRICAKKTYKATAQAGTTVCPANFTDNGTTCLAPAAVTSNSPEGWLDAISNTGVANGWVTDADVPNTPIDVHFYIDGVTTYIGKTTASYVRTDLPAPYNTGRNGYDFRIPEAYCDSKPHTLYAYGIDAPVFVNNPLLNGAPKSFTLTPAQCGYSTTITNSNVGTGNCGTGNIALQGSTVNCNFPLTGSPTGIYTLPTQGLMATLLVTGGNTSADYGKSNSCTVIGSTLSCTNIPVPSNTPVGAREIAILQPTVQWMMNKGFINVQAATVVTNGTEITQTNTGTGTCNPTQVSVGSLTTCSYPLTGDIMSQYKLPLTPIKAKISTVTNSSADCQIFNNATPTASLVCANVPSLGGTIGAQTATLNLTGETSSAPISLIAATAMSTVITADQTGNGKCTPVTITIGNLTLCDFPLMGAMNNTYSMPISGIKAQISTANSLSTPCQISNNGTISASLTCTQVPTSGATAGSQTARLNLAGETNSAPVTLIAATTTLGTNPMGELSGKVGELVGGFITTTGSTYSGPATFSNGTSCNIAGVVSLGIFSPVQGSLVPSDCPIGSLSNGVIKAGGNVDLPGVKSNFAKSDLTMDDLKKITIQCNGGKAVTVNSTTTCTFLLPDNKILPKELLFGIGDSKPAGICTLKDKTVTCVNIPTGSKLGLQALNSRINGGATFDTGKKITVNASAMLSKTGNSIGFIFGLTALMATSFSLALTMSLSLAKQKK